MSKNNRYQIQPTSNKSITKHHSKNKRSYKTPKILFTPNIFGNSRINTGNKDVTGYIKREVYTKDSNGNVQVAREVQVLNSWDKIGYFSDKE